MIVCNPTCLLALQVHLTLALLHAPGSSSTAIIHIHNQWLFNYSQPSPMRRMLTQSGSSAGTKYKNSHDGSFCKTSRRRSKGLRQEAKIRTRGRENVEILGLGTSNENDANARTDAYSTTVRLATNSHIMYAHSLCATFWNISLFLTAQSSWFWTVLSLQTESPPSINQIAIIKKSKNLVRCNWTNRQSI